MRTAPQRPFGVAVPVRAFTLGNTRLAGGLDEAIRARFAPRLAARVVRAAGDAPVVIVTDAPEVAAWATALGADIVADPGSLDGAAAVGVDALRRLGCRRAVVAHADLPFVSGFGAVTHDAGQAVAVLVPCHHDDGTPVLSVPTDVVFPFAYGPGSFRRHAVAAGSVGLAVRVVRDPALAFDVDTMDDMAELERRDPTLLGARPVTGVPAEVPSP